MVYVGFLMVSMIRLFDKKPTIVYGVFALGIVAITPVLLLNADSKSEMKEDRLPSARLRELIWFFLGVAISILTPTLIRTLH